jgi:hypothetical protein
MEQIAYQRERALRAYLSDEALPESEWPAVDVENREILDYLAKSLSLSPVNWTVADFEAMQRRVFPQLRFKPKGAA